MTDTSAAEETAALAASLAAWLAPVEIRGLSGRQTTALLTDRVAEWARSQGWSVRFEVASRITRTVNRAAGGSSEWQGRLDVVCSRRPGQPPVAIEIDRNNKRWSVEKLSAEAAAGSVALWVRWRGGTDIDVPATVGLVDIVPPEQPLSPKQVAFLVRLALSAPPTQFTAMFAAVVRGTNIEPQRDGELVRDTIGRLSASKARRLIGLLRQAERGRRST